MKKLLPRYIKILGERLYNPIKPLVSPLLSRVKLIDLLAAGLVVMLVGVFWLGEVKQQKIEQAAWWPWSAEKRAELAIGLFESGDEEGAIEELGKANELVIWETESVVASLKRAEVVVNQPEEIRQEIQAWEKVLEVKPYYRDVLLRLAILNYQILEGTQAKEYFEQANYLDPNNKEVKRVGEIISSVLP